MTFHQIPVTDQTTTDVNQAIEDALDAPHHRVVRYRTRLGRVLWIKRVEHSALLLWLVKGAPEKAFDRDRRAHRFLWERGAPVPAIIAEGADYFALEDAGTSLTEMHKDASVTALEKAAACEAAGQALARLHSVDLSHGRPAFRDMCWDGRRVRFIDFEYFVPSKAGFFRKARDLCITTLSALAQGVEGPRSAFRVLSAYATAMWGRQKAFLVPRRAAEVTVTPKGYQTPERPVRTHRTRTPAKPYS